MNEALALSQLSQFPPWHLQGEAFILNYWISPQFIRQYKAFRIAPSPIGRVVQVMLVRYHQSPVGPYDELLLLDHPLWLFERNPFLLFHIHWHFYYHLLDLE